MKKVHDNVHKRYSDKTMLTIKTKLLKIEQAPVNKGTFIGTRGTLGQVNVRKGAKNKKCPINARFSL